MVAFLTTLAVACFLLHVVLLFTSFPSGGFLKNRYRASHITLWLTGIFLFLTVWLYGGKTNSDFLEYFDTPIRKVAILVTVLVLSVAAHMIVKRFVRPMINKGR